MLLTWMLHVNNSTMMTAMRSHKTWARSYLNAEALNTLV